MTTATTFKSITCRELNELCQSGRSVDLIDVRTPVEFREVHSIYARNIPLICRSGNRSTKACEAFVAAGFTNIVNVEGGTQAWDEGGYAVTRGKKAMSLERQVRIAAGFLVFAGTMLGFLHHQYWLAIPAFVGAGLVFAGITDTCGMGMLISKMPWNQVKDTCDTGSASSEALQQQAGGSCCG
jgi:rhodanese-related sulfurtransferase